MKILLVEDDELQRAALTKLLEANRYTLDFAKDGQAGLDLATIVDYDLVLLDVGLPKLDGIHLCQALRSQGYTKPILLISANDTDADAIAGFESGADDYISKSCAPEVLLARMRTLLRRSRAVVDRAANSKTLAWDTLRLDPDSGRATVNEQVVTLTATEYNLLELFLQHPNRVFSRSAILDKLWSFEDAPTDRAIVTHIKDLRKKLKASGLAEDLIETIYGMGYRLKPAPQSPRTHPKASNTNPTVAQVFERFRDTFNAQVAILTQVKAALLSGTLSTTLQQSAQREAHKLAGSLATYGYPEGSKLGRSLEHLLTRNSPFTPEEIARYGELVTALQRVLARAPASQAVSPISTPLKGRVLAIDDDPALSDRLTAEAAAWGVQMQVVATLAEARLRLHAETPDLVLLDLSFPEEDGLALLGELTQQSPALPTIVFTGRDSLADRLAVSRLGARQFLHKPATTEQIFSTIVRVLETPQSAEAKVLIVDDDPAVLARLSSMLTPWGLEVVTLSDPQQFWEVLVATAPRVVLLDLEMPGISGLDLCQVVRQDMQWGDLPILVVTAHTDAESLNQAFAAGADDFITKPVLGPELVTRVLSRVERLRAQQNGKSSPLRGNDER